ncbi:MAG: GAF domain-containing protein, partial [Anaerolineales bacterium]|nr:GAF domain-containing protein [Anaerolineales bacterium]
MLAQVSAGQEAERMLPLVLRAVANVLEAQRGSLFITDEHLVVQASWFLDGHGLAELGEADFALNLIENGLVGHVMRLGESILVGDTMSDERWLKQVGDDASTSTWSAIGVPLATLARGITLGAIVLARPGADQYNEDDVIMLNSIAAQLASTLGVNHLQAETNQHSEEIVAFMETTAAISATLDVDKINTLVTQHLVQLTNMDSCILVDWDEKASSFRSRHIAGRTPGTTYDLGQASLLQEILARPRAVQIQASNEDNRRAEQLLLNQLQAQSLLLLPLVAHQEAFGVAILCNWHQQHLFNDLDIYLFQTLANQAAVTIQNAHLYTETQRQLKITRLLNDASQVINSSLDLNQIMKSLLSQMNEFLQAEAVSIALVDRANGELVFTIAEGVGSDQITGMRVPSSQGVSGWVMQHNAPALVNDIDHDERFYREGDERTGHKTEAMICAPIHVKGKVLGTIQAINPAEKSYFTNEEMQLLVNLANLASSAMANAQQFNRTQAAENRYMGLFQDNIDPIILTDKVGRIIEVNGRAIELLEYERTELLRMRINQLHPVETGLLGERSFQPIQTRQIKMFTSEIITKNRKRTPVEVYAKRIYMGDNQLLQWIYHDITQQVELSQMRDDLMAMLFHDLRSPLSNIISSLAIVLEDLPSGMDESVVNMLDVAMKSSQGLQRLVKSLLDINRLEAGHPINNQKAVMVVSLIDEAQEIVQATVSRRGITIERMLASDVVSAYVDEDMIRRVIINLMDNALKYSQDGQVVTVEVRRLADEGMLHVAVSDQGPGIPRRYREVIFEKFRRIEDKQARKGIGLGLAFCRLAVEAHGGRIWVDSG